MKIFHTTTNLSTALRRLACLPVLFLLTYGQAAFGQSKTTEALHKENHEALSLFFYNNTLRMLNQSEDKEFDALIKDIEKMKFLMVKKDEHFGMPQYKTLISDYQKESYEEIMSSRYQGRNFDVFLKEKNGKTQGMIVAVNDSTTLYVLDILGSIALDNVTKLFNSIDESTDIAKKIEAFTKKD